MAQHSKTNQVPWPRAHHPLPSDFAMEVLKKEIELEKQPSSALLHELIELYVRAIEHYEHKKDPRYAKFQDRMHQLLVKPQIFHLLHAPKPSRSQTNSRKKFVTTGPAYKTRDRSRTMKCMVDRHHSQTKSITKKAINDLASQESTLARRMNQRKAASANNSFNTSNFDTAGTANASFEDLLEIEDKPDDFQQELEMTLEQLYAEETRKVVEITTEYKLKIAQLGDSVIEKVKKKVLEGEMKNIIEQFKQASKEKRKAVMKQIRAKYTLA